MRKRCLLALLFCACRIELETPAAQKSCETLTVDVCANEAPMHSDFQWIADNILYKNCTGSACHQKVSSSAKAAKLVFDDDADRAGVAFHSLVTDKTGQQVLSDVVQGVPLVEPGAPDQSYLFFLMKGVDKGAFMPTVGDPPDDVGYMPRGNETLCCQKLDAIQRWIEAGAPND